MNTTAALWIGGCIIAVFAADYVFLDSTLWVNGMKQLIRLMNWIAFWR